MSAARPRPLEPVPTTGDPRLDAFARLLAIVDRLRASDGCPWDLEQTVASLAPSLVEEAHEAVEKIDEQDDRGTVEELGDLLLVVTLIAKVAAQGERFDVAAVGEAVCAKLVRRHPHVFGDVAVDSSAQALANWEKLKEAERKQGAKDSSALAGVPVALPALQRASRVAAKAISAGFRWSDAGGALDKLREEMRELEQALAQAAESSGAKPANAAPVASARVEEELGDVLIAAAFAAHYLDLDPERAARAALRRFEQRFRSMEARLGDRLRAAPLAELMQAWAQAKADTAAKDAQG